MSTPNRTVNTVARAADTAADRRWELRATLPSPRDAFGVGYGRSSGYAARRSYLSGANRSSFRIG